MISEKTIHKILDKYFKHFKIKVQKNETFPWRYDLYGTSYYYFGLDNWISEKEAEQQIFENLLFAFQDLKEQLEVKINQVIKVMKERKQNERNN